MYSKYVISAVAVFIGIFLVLPYNANAQSTPTTTPTSNENPSPNPNSSNACGHSPQQSQGQIPPFCAKLIVIKEVDNTLGGTAVPSDFTLSVTGNNPSQSTFQGSSSGTTIVIGPGSYQITEVSSPPNYFPAKHHGGSCQSGTISAGQTITCTIVNRFKPPADTQPPQVLSFTVSPMTVSLSSGGTVTITAHVTDQTGVERVGVYVQDQCGNSPGFFQSLQLPLVSGTPQDGIYQAPFTFPQLAYDNVVQSCSPNGIDAYFEAGGLTSDTLGNQAGLPLITNIILTR